MKFFYILNKNKKIIDTGKIISDRGFLIESMINLKINLTNFSPLKLYQIEIDSFILERKIKSLLIERNSKPLDIPSYDKVFWKEKDIFQIKKFNKTEYRLCNSGFDNKIIFLINLYNCKLKDDTPWFIFLTKNHKEYNNAVSVNFKSDIKMNLFSKKLETQYKNIELKSWSQFYNNFAIKAFEMNDKEYTSYLKSIRCPFGFIGKASKAKKVYKAIQHFEELDDEVKKVIAIITSGDLLEKKSTTYNDWLNSLKWKDFKKEEEYSIIDIASFEYGNNYIKARIMEMPIFKIF